MNNVKIPSDHHVARYIKATLVHGDYADGSAFILRENESGLSVNWLEAFNSNDLCFQLSEVRRLSRIRLSTNGKFAKLNVGNTKQYVHTRAENAGISVSLEFLKVPLGKTSKWEADLSHAEITGIPPRNSVEAAVIGDFIAKSVQFPLIQGIVD